ncbi:hypothetical protein SRHO_G00247460 [Serrasalmus rhombeus]
MKRKATRPERGQNFFKAISLREQVIERMKGRKPVKASISSQSVERCLQTQSGGRPGNKVLVLQPDAFLLFGLIPRGPNSQPSHGGLRQSRLRSADNLAEVGLELEDNRNMDFLKAPENWIGSLCLVKASAFGQRIAPASFDPKWPALSLWRAACGEGWL